jgi:hypothetical protein
MTRKSSLRACDDAAMTMRSSHPSTASFDDHQRWLRIASRFQLSCMSNAKWRKVFTAIAESAVDVRRCEFKCIDSDYVTVHSRAPQVSELLERRFTDGLWQPFEYKWIEWFRFPRQFQPYPGVGLVVTQDVEALQTVIARAAQACVELDDQYLWLYGYRGLLTT